MQTSVDVSKEVRVGVANDETVIFVDYSVLVAINEMHVAGTEILTLVAVVYLIKPVTFCLCLGSIDALSLIAVEHTGCSAYLRQDGSAVSLGLEGLVVVGKGCDFVRVVAC